MGTALAPVQAGPGEATAGGAGPGEVDAQPAQEPLAGGCELVVPAPGDQPPALHENGGELDAHAPGQVVVASAGEADRLRLLALAEGAGRGQRGDAGQRLEQVRHLGTGEPVVAVPAAPL